MANIARMQESLANETSQSSVWRLAADIGGTFTDVVLEGPDAQISRKVLTTSEAPEAGVIDGVAQALASAGIAAADVSIVLHGTTLATNALIERKGARTALITTAGFRDLLATGYEKRFDHYDLFIEHPAPVVPRHWRLGVSERMAADGTVLAPLNEQEVAAAAAFLRDEGVEAVAIGFLHSYVNAVHERRAGEIVAAVLGEQATVCLSSAVCPEIREYERFSTTACNAYVRPLMAGYLHRLNDGLRAMGFKAPLYLMMSSGGLTTMQLAAEMPIRLVESGPAGGAILAADIARQCRLDDVLSFDMGGTTAKICLLRGAQPAHARRFEVARTYRHRAGSGWPVRIPVIEMVEIGAGGGSIARVDAMQRITVGPDSAGSRPGPACYGRGGEAPTVTDANLVLGRIDGQRFAAGTLVLDDAAARRSLVSRVGNPMALDDVWAAAGVVEIVDENMANAARLHAIERGCSIERCTMIAFGGGAPLHAGRLAEKLGIDRVIVPPGAGVGSAIGFLRAPISFEVTRSAQLRLDEFDAGLLNGLLDEMIAQARAVIEPGLGSARPSVRSVVDCRYVGQGHEVTVPLSHAPLLEIHAGDIRAEFERRYRRAYGLIIENMPVEIVTVSTVVACAASTRISPPSAAAAPPSSRPQRRSVYEPAIGEFCEMPVYWRGDCEAGVTIDGPAVIAEDETSVVVPGSFAASIDSLGNIVLQRRPGR